MFVSSSFCATCNVFIPERLVPNLPHLDTNANILLNAASLSARICSLQKRERKRKKEKEREKEEEREREGKRERERERKREELVPEGRASLVMQRRRDEQADEEEAMVRHKRNDESFDRDIK